MKRKPVLILLCITVLAPMVLYTDRLSAAFSTPLSNDEFLDDVPDWSFGKEAEKLNALHLESSDAMKESIELIYSDNSSNSDQILSHSSDELVKELAMEKPREHKSRVLSATDEGTQSEQHAIKQVTERVSNVSSNVQISGSGSEETKEKKLVT